MQKVILVGIGGFLGACIRYIITLNSAKLFGTNFPYGTLAVNVTGGIIIGFIMELSQTSNLLNDSMKIFLTTGIMGGLTTFSTFSYETISLFSSGNYTYALLNTALNIIFSFSGVILGKYAALII